MKALKAFSITAIAGSKQMILSPSTVESTIGKFFTIEWEKVNGNLRLANAQLKHFETPSGKKTENAGAAHYMVLTDNNKRNSDGKGVIRVALDKVNYFCDAGTSYGVMLMKGRKNDPLPALGNVR
jgi:hypothetical protein